LLLKETLQGRNNRKNGKANMRRWGPPTIQKRKKRKFEKGKNYSMGRGGKEKIGEKNWTRDGNINQFLPTVI